MLKNLFGYILSLRRKPEPVLTKREQLAALHKMKEPDLIRIAILSCEIVLEEEHTELRVKERLSKTLRMRSVDVESLLGSLLVIRNAVAVPADQKGRKYFTVPAWFGNQMTTVSVDDYFIFDDNRCHVFPKVKVMYELLKEVEDLLGTEDNKKFVDYYVDKGRKVYIEVAAIAAMFI